MKALSLWQPYASAIALGIKTFETRTWSTNYRGELAIHAAKTRVGWQDCEPEFLRELARRQYASTHAPLAGAFFPDKALAPEFPREADFPHGAIVAIVEIVDCIRMTSDFIEAQSILERLAGDWRVGRYAWKFSECRVVDPPIFVRGAQALFEVDFGPTNHSPARANLPTLFDEVTTSPRLRRGSDGIVRTHTG